MPDKDRALLLFDLDGTLIDSAAIILEAQRLAFESLSLPVPDRERGLSIVGLSLTEAFEALVGRDGPVADLAEAYRQAFYTLRTSGRDLETLFPGAKDLISGLSGTAAHTLGIATGKSRRGVGAIIETYGWRGIFETIQTSDDAPSKPHPGMIENACRDTGISAGRAIMIGDSSYDMRMARAAGARAIGVAWGFQSPELLIESGAEIIVPDMAALAAEIERIASGR